MNWRAGCTRCRRFCVTSGSCFPVRTSARSPTPTSGRCSSGSSGRSTASVLFARFQRSTGRFRRSSGTRARRSSPTGLLSRSSVCGVRRSNAAVPGPPRIEADMSSGPPRPFISVKFSPVGRTFSFLLPELALDANGDYADARPAPEPLLARRCRHRQHGRRDGTRDRHPQVAGARRAEGPSAGFRAAGRPPRDPRRRRHAAQAAAPGAGSPAHLPA